MPLWPPAPLPSSLSASPGPRAQPGSPAGLSRGLAQTERWELCGSARRGGFSQACKGEMGRPRPGEVGGPHPGETGVLT